jgi:hypothetical protein
VPRDLETICLKCLEKGPRQRYASALALGEDLARFQKGEPILARPASPAERGLKWVKRRPTQALLAGVICVAVLALLTIWAVLTAQLVVERNHAQQEEGLAKEAEGQAKEQAARAEANQKLAEQQEKRAKALLLRCTSVVAEYATATVQGKSERMVTGEPGTVLYVLASYYARTAGATFPEDANLWDKDRNKLTEEYAARAVYLLQQAEQLRFFARPENREKLRHDKELEALRSRPDFQELLRRVGGGK